MASVDINVAADATPILTAPFQSLRKPAKVIWVAAILLMALASAQAWLGLSRDYLEYVDYYQTIPPFFSFSDTRFEPGFHLIAWAFSNKIRAPYWVFSFFIVAVSLSIKAYLFRKYLRYPVLSSLVYLATFYPNQEYTQIRAAAAISFGLLAIHALFERRFLITAALPIVAVSFHYSIVLLFAAFAAAYFLRRNFISLVGLSLAALTVSVMALSDGGLNSFIVSWFSNLNPLVGNYVDNIAAINAASIWSVNNLIVIAVFGAAVFAGWLSHDQYQKCFTIMFGMSVVFVVLLAQSPIIAVRAKEMLLVPIVLASFRHPINQRSVIPVVLVCANAALLLFLAIREGVILSTM